VCDWLELHDLVSEDTGFEALILCDSLPHCRRHFDKAAKVAKAPSGQQQSRVAIKDSLGKVFHIERQLDEQREACDQITQ
jgi:hypothetical protein